MIQRVIGWAVIALFVALPSTGTPHTLIKGVALLDWQHMEDLTALSAPNFYGWGEGCAGQTSACTNMVRNWQLPAACYPKLLVGNEPVNAEPAGHPISVHDAVTSTLAIRAMCPNMQLIVANIYFGWDWLAQFYAEYKLLAGHEYGTIPHASGLLDLVGFHVYSNTHINGALQAQLFMALAGYKGHFWVTEFRVTDFYDNPGAYLEFKQFLKWMGLQPRIDRAYVWTNRGTAGWDSLVNANGTLNTEGQQYRDWQPAATVWQTQFPFVKGASQGYP